MNERVEIELKDDGGAAFPCHTNPRPGHLANAPQGMTLRDYFAAAAMQGDMASQHEGWDHTDWKFLAKKSYLIADAMLEARK